MYDSYRGPHTQSPRSSRSNVPRKARALLKNPPPPFVHPALPSSRLLLMPGHYRRCQHARKARINVAVSLITHREVGVKMQRRSSPDPCQRVSELNYYVAARIVQVFDLAQDVEDKTKTSPLHCSSQPPCVGVADAWEAILTSAKYLA